MKSNKILVVLIIILSISVLILSGYVLYDKLLDKDSDMIDNNDNGGLLSDDEALNIVKELTKKYFPYEHSLGPYCGDTDYNDYISFGSYETMNFRDYTASTTYKSINDIKKYFEIIMIEKLMPKYLDDGVSYIEQDGKLYCQLSHKGCGDMYKEESSTFNINSIDNDKISFDVILASETCGSLLTRRKGTIEIIKNKDNNFVISKYDVQINLD